MEKIIPDFDKQQLQNLNRVNTIRNYFAHCNQELFFGSLPPLPDSKGIVPDPRRLDREINFENLYDEFSGIIEDLTRYLAKTYQEKGGELYAYREGKFVEVKEKT